jgi:dolichol-phosphate mannosyltransferase
LPGHLVIIPTYNERENISDIIDAVQKLDFDFHVLIVDDGSPDGTAELVKEAKAQYPEAIHLVERSGKLGLGTAYVRGFQYALSRNYDFVYEMDADFSHNPKDLLRMAAVLEDDLADVVIGSRYIKDGKLENWPMDRIFLSYGASLYVRFVTGLPVKDPTAGFIGYKAGVLESIDLTKIESIGYAFQIEMKYAAWKKNFRLKEIPITFKDREKGESKMSSAIIREAARGVLKIKSKHR